MNVQTMTVIEVAQHAVDNDGQMPVLFVHGQVLAQIERLRFLDVPEVEIVLTGGKTLLRNADDEIEVSYG